MGDRWFIVMQHLLPKHALSRFGGWLASSERPWIRRALIGWFMRNYPIDLSEARVYRPEGFTSFNDFFTRALKPEARPIAPGGDTIVCPADGQISQFGSITKGQLLQAKGIEYSLQELTGIEDDGAFEGGSFATVYLAPHNYHRVHLPLAGTLTTTTAIPGELFSVNAATSRGVANLFGRNERLVCHFDTAAGEMLVVFVGALIVASIETVWPGPASPYRRRVSQQVTPTAFAKGDEIGRFLLGSTAIVCFERGPARWHSELQPGQVVRMGQAIGTVRD